MTTVSTTKTAVTATPKATLSAPLSVSEVRMQQEMMAMRETDQWMTEHYRNRA